MRKADIIHSEVFGSNIPIRQYDNVTVNQLSDEPPPLMSLSTGIHVSNTIVPDAAPPELCKAAPGSNMQAVFEHNCKYAFMRSQLSRMLRDGQFDSDGLVLMTERLPASSDTMRNGVLAHR